MSDILSDILVSESQADCKNKNFSFPIANSKLFTSLVTLVKSDTIFNHLQPLQTAPIWRHNADNWNGSSSKNEYEGLPIYCSVFQSLAGWMQHRCQARPEIQNCYSSTSDPGTEAAAVLFNHSSFTNVGDPPTPTPTPPPTHQMNWRTSPPSPQ